MDLRNLSQCLVANRNPKISDKYFFKPIRFSTNVFWDEFNEFYTLELETKCTRNKVILSKELEIVYCCSVFYFAKNFIIIETLLFNEKQACSSHVYLIVWIEIRGLLSRQIANPNSRICEHDCDGSMDGHNRLSGWIGLSNQQLRHYSARSDCVCRYQCRA